MKRKNGFTLIELLAIIVILAIIAVITVPIILGIIEDASENTAKDSAYGYKDAVNKYYAQQLLSNQNLKLNGTYTVTNGTLTVGDANTTFGDENVTSFPVQVSGEKPSAGELHYSNNELKGGCLVIGDYAVTFNNDRTTSTEKGNCSEYEYDDGSLKIGASVAYSTTLNGVTLNNWKVFYNEGDYTYLIIDGYLPSSAINITGLGTRNNYVIYGEYGVCKNKMQFMDILSAESGNWDSLLIGTINGNNINETRGSNIWAMGSPTLDLWVNSWNNSYPDDKIYFEYYPNLENSSYDPEIDPTSEYYEEQYYPGYLIDKSNPAGETSIPLENRTNTLYFPLNGEENTYRLASPSADGYEDMIAVTGGGMHYDGGFSSMNLSLRPIIKLPTSVVNQ